MGIPNGADYIPSVTCANIRVGNTTSDTVIIKKIRVVGLGSETVTISNLGNGQIATPTILQWVKFDINGSTYYAPAWS